MNGSNIVEDLVFTKLAEEISKEIDYSGIAKKVAPMFKKRMIEEAKRQVEEDVDFEHWVSDVLQKNVLDEAMSQVADELATGMLSALKNTK